MAHQATNTESIVYNHQVIEAIDRYFPGNQTLQVAGQSLTPAELKARLQAEVDATKTVKATRARLQAEVRVAAEAKATGQATRSALRSYVLGIFGAKHVEMLGDFGFKAPPSSATRTVERKAEAIAKAKATRLARHTMGKKQRLAIKGVVPTPPVADPPDDP